MLKKLISQDKIQARVKELASEIDQDYQGKEIYTICILNGGKPFHRDILAELAHLGRSMQYQEITISSYDGETSTGTVKIKGEVEVSGRDILVVEDIVDTGRSMSKLLPELKKMGAKSVRICTFLNKPSRRAVEVKLDYVGLDIDDLFVVGYGMDFNELYRELLDICVYTNP